MEKGPGIERVLQRVRNQIENRSYYEAQQSYKTIYHRYKARNMISQSHKVLEEGACLQLSNKQITCGVELGRLLLEDYQASEGNLDDSTVSSFRRIVQSLPKPDFAQPNADRNVAEIEEGCRFIDSVIRWLKKKDMTNEWYMEFNALAGDYLVSWEGWSALGRITIYYARGRNWMGLTTVLLDCMQSAHASEEDLFICRTVLQILLYSTVEPVKGAEAFLECYGQGKPIPQTPLIRFTIFLLEAIRLNSQRLVRTLSTKYANVLNRDKHLEHLLMKLTRKFFPFRPGNILTNILDGMLGGSNNADRV